MCIDFAGIELLGVLGAPRVGFIVEDKPPSIRYTLEPDAVAAG